MEETKIMNYVCPICGVLMILTHDSFGYTFTCPDDDCIGSKQYLLGDYLYALSLKHCAEVASQGQWGDIGDWHGYCEVIRACIRHGASDTQALSAVDWIEAHPPKAHLQPTPGIMVDIEAIIRKHFSTLPVHFDFIEGHRLTKKIEAAISAPSQPAPGLRDGDLVAAYMPDPEEWVFVVWGDTERDLLMDGAISKAVQLVQRDVLSAALAQSEREWPEIIAILEEAKRRALGVHGHSSIDKINEAIAMLTNPGMEGK